MSAKYAKKLTLIPLFERTFVDLVANVSPRFMRYADGKKRKQDRRAIDLFDLAEALNRTQISSVLVFLVVPKRPKIAVKV